MFVAGASWAGGQPVSFPGPGLELAGRLYLPGGRGPFPAIVMLHGCSGLWSRSGEPTPSYRFWAEHFRDRGFAALLVDSFGPRGEKEICTQASRPVSESKDRPRDAHSALAWLASRGDVDRERIHLMGWSNGGSAVLHALRPDAAPGDSRGARFRSAVAFYPGCALLSRGEFLPAAPLLIQAGEADDWTPASQCRDLAERAPAGSVEIDVYAEAHHGFDRLGLSVRERPDVRNRNRPGGRGATVGANPEARARAIERATAWIESRSR